MKILYVEDELSKNIPKIINLFKQLLEEKIIRELEKLETDESGYGAKPDEIKKIVSQSDLVDIEYNFSDVIKKFNHELVNYKIFIIDRNLSEYPYKKADIQKLDPQFQDVFFEKFKEREGDYLMEKLITGKIDVKNQLFFLTANASDNLRNKDQIEDHINYGRFLKENIIDKSDSDAMKKLRYRILNEKSIKLKRDNLKYIKILNKISPNISDNFINLLDNKDKSDHVSIRKNLTTIRNILSDNLLPEIALRKEAPKKCWNEKNNNQIVMRAILYWLFHFDDTKGYKFKSNSIIRNFLYDIQEIGSDFGDHKKYKENKSFQPTTDTVNALIYALKDIIMWFEENIIK